MAEIVRSRRVFSQIEFFLSEAKYEYAEALLFQLLNQDPSDRESRLYLLLVNVTREGPVLYEEDIDQLRNLSNLDDNEKEIVRKLFVLGFKSAKKEGRKDQIWAYQELLRRLLLNQQLEPPIPRSSARTPPAHQEPTPKLIDRTLDLARLKAISLGWLVAVLEKTSSVCQIWFSRASQTIWPLKLSHTALAIAVTPLMIPIAYFSLPQAATETSGYANATLSQPMLANSVLAVDPVELSRQHDDVEVRWEQILDSSKTEAKAILPVYIANLRLDGEKSKSTIQANPRRAGLKVAQAVETDRSKTQKLAAKPDRGIEYRTRRLAPLRQEPSYGAPKIQDIDTGATISVLETNGDWLKVQAGPSVGYVRKEYVAPLTTSQ
jgi:Bacterial SH3 domain